VKRIGWKAWVGIGLSALFLWWIFRNEDLGAIGQQIADADPGMLVAAGAISTGGGALRWRLLLEPLAVSTTLKARWAALNIGYMVTNLFPARLGDIVRPFALSRMAPVSTSGALGTVVLERVLDTVALLILLLVTLLSPAFPAGATVLGRPIASAVSAAVVVAAAALAVIGTMILWPHIVLRLARGLARALPSLAEARTVGALEAFLSGLELIRRPTALLKALLWSLLLWLWMAASLWAAFRAFGIELGFTAAVFTQCAVSLFTALPAGPGAIGTLQAGVLVSLHGVFTVPTGPALSLAVGYHLAGFVPGTLLGLYYAWKLGLHLRSIESDAEKSLEAGG